VAGGGSRKAGEKPMKYLTITLETAALSP